MLSVGTRRRTGQGVGCDNAIRELGGVFGVAVLASVFAHAGGYTSPETFTNGTSTAVWIGGAVVALGAVAAAFIPRRPAGEVVGVETEALAEAA